MNLTKRQEIQLNKVFDDPKKLRKWVDDVYMDMINECEIKTKQMINEYLDIYSVVVAYTLKNECGFGKKRLPDIMSKIWSNMDELKDNKLSYYNCIDELKEYGIIFDVKRKDDDNG